MLLLCDRTIKDGMTALYIAAERGFEDVIQVLLSNRAHVNIPRDDGTTPLLVASSNGHAKIVARLLDAGADVNAASVRTVTPRACVANLDQTRRRPRPLRGRGALPQRYEGQHKPVQ
eukprot:48928-Eustigmatos_ZCMA.PRE.1